MDEIMNEAVVSENEASYDDFVAEQTEAGDGKAMKIIAGVVATAIGVAGGAAIKKFGPSLKAKAKEAKINRLKKRNEKLANEQLAVQTKLNQMQSASEEAKKEE